jgi:hypothetical protein
LVETDGFEPGFRGGGALVEGANRGDAGVAKGGAEAGSGVGDHRLLTVLEEREVGCGVADVGEVVAKAGLEGGEFIFAGEVVLAVGGEDAGEEAEMVGDAVGGAGIGGGGQVDGAAGGALLLKILKEFAIVGEMGDVELDGIGEMTLEGSFALKEPAGDAEERCGALPGDGEGGVIEGVRLDQGPVEVDAKDRVDADRWRGGEAWGRGLNRQKFLPCV